MAQIVGSASEIILFFSGFFLGKEMFVIAGLLIVVKVISKISISELMYNRMRAVVREGNQYEEKYPNKNKFTRPKD